MTTLLIQTDRILGNLNSVQSKLSVPVIADLSCNAYGMGDIPCMRLLREQGSFLYAVNRLEEAERLLDDCPKADVLLRTPYATEQDVAKIVQRNIIASVGSVEGAVLLSGAAAAAGRTVRVHLKFDVGDSPAGFFPEDAARAAQTMRHLSGVEVLGMYADINPLLRESKARVRYERFMSAAAQLAREGLQAPLSHIATVASALKYPWMKLDAVRMGSELAGRSPLKDAQGLARVGRLVSEVADVRWAQAGSRAAGKHVRRATRLACLPVGTADGLRVEHLPGGLFGRSGEIGGRKAPMFGKPQGAYTLLNVTKLDCAAGDQVSFDLPPEFVSPTLRRDYV